MAVNSPSSKVLSTDSRILQDGGINFDAASLIYDIGLKFIHLLEGALVIFAGLMLMKIVRAYLLRIQTTHDNQKMAMNLLEKLISGFLVVVTITLALKVIGLDLTLLISSLALGLSFGLKDIIKNYVSGILILFKSPFSIGDIVRIKRFTGTVDKIDFQSTTLKTFDRKEVTIYNKDILSQSITNYTKEKLRRLEITMTLGRGTDTARALAVFETILENHPRVLKNPRFTIVFKSFSQLGMTVMVRFWVERPVNILKVRTELALQLEQSFDEIMILSPYTKGIEFNDDFSMSENRKKRIEMFYTMPMLVGIAEQTTQKLQAIFAAPEAEVLDREEPEYEE